MGLLGKLRWEKQKRSQRAHYEEEVKKAEARKQGKIEPLFQPLQALRGSQRGRCVILGADVQSSILDRLNHECTLCSAAGWEKLKKTGWQPTYLGIQSPSMLEQIKEYIDKIPEQGILAGDNLTIPSPTPKNWIAYPYLGVYKYYCNEYDTHHVKFSGDALEVVYDGYDTVYSLMQIAVYLGFTDLVLVGCGCCHPQEEKMQSAFRTAKQYADTHGIHIYNGTPGETDDIFPLFSL